MKYEIEVDFHPDVSDTVASNTYYGALLKYDAIGIGQDEPKHPLFSYLQKIL